MKAETYRKIGFILAIPLLIFIGLLCLCVLPYLLNSIWESILKLRDPKVFLACCVVLIILFGIIGMWMVITSYCTEEDEKKEEKK